MLKGRAVQKALIVLLLSTVMVAGSSAQTASGPDDSSTSKVIPVEELHFYQNKQGLTVANGWGDPATGPHSNFIRMPGKAMSGLHTHSFNYYGVVVSGVLANEASDGVPARSLRPGSYWFQAGGKPHVTNCLSTSECLIFVTSKGPFDFHLVAAPSDPATQQPKR